MLISELPELEQRLIQAIMAGVPVKEIARQCGRSPAWVHARLAEAKKRIGAGIVLL
jgi:DNA-binding NarL/FixJ family response regulator